MCIASLIHRSILLLSLSITLAQSQSVTWLREITWSVTANCFALLLRIYWCFECMPSHHVVQLLVDVPVAVPQKLYLFLQYKFCHSFCTFHVSVAYRSIL